MNNSNDLQQIAETLRNLTMQVVSLQAQQEREREVAPENKYMTFEQACKFLGVTRSALYTMTSRKKVPHYKPSGKAVYFLREDLERWITAKRVKSNDELMSEAAALIV